MKKISRKIIIFSLIAFLIFILFGKVYAADSLEINDELYSENYKEWLKLPEEERKNTMMPQMFNIPYKKENTSSENNYWTNQYNDLVKALSEDLDYYNLSDDIDITVKDQGYTGECWAFSITSILETTVSKLTGQASEIFSPRHIDYSTLSKFSDTEIDNNVIRDVGSGGNFFIGSGYLARGSGPVLEKDMPVVVDKKEGLINSSEIQGKEVQLRVKDIEWFPSINKKYSSDGITYNDGINQLTETEVEEIRDEVKEHILTKGAVFGGVPGALSGNYNPETFAYYSTDDPLGHAVTIVGWDDNFPKENFLESNRPLHDGAWIVLNSYGTENNAVYKDLTASYGEGYDGYFYVSYDDAIIETSMGGVNEVSDVDYDNIHQYDDVGVTSAVEGTSGVTIGATFDKPEKKEYLNEIGLFIFEEQYVSVLYSSGNTNKVITERQKVHAGFNTIELTSPIELTDSYDILVVFESLNGTDNVIVPIEYNDYENGNNMGAIQFNPDISGKTYVLLGNVKSPYEDRDFCIKAFTTEEYRQTIEPESITLNKTGKITMNVNSTEKLIATILPENANSKTGITWKSSNTSVAEVSNTGEITAKSAGETVITATTENGKIAELEVKVINEDEIALDINTEDNVKYIVGNEKLFSVQLINIPDSEKENVNISLSDTSIAEITQIDKNSSDDGKVYFKVRFKNPGKVDILANIEYNGSSFEYKFSFEVKSEETVKTVESIRVKTLPTKTKYNKGEDLDLEGGIIEITYSDGTTEEVPMTDSNVIITGYDKTRTGVQTITVNYSNKLTTYVVQVVDESGTEDDKTVSSIRIKSRPTKTEYIVGEDLDLEGGVIEVSYLDGTKEEIPMTDSSVTITGYDKQRTGTQTLTVNYKNKLATFSVTVKEETDDDGNDEVTITKISVKTRPTKTSYKVGEELNLEGGILEVTYSDGSVEEVPLTDSKVKISGYDNNKIGMQLVTVSYENKLATFSVQVSENKEPEEGNDEPSNVKSITIKKLPNKTTYKTGEELDLEGGIIEVTYLDGTKEEIPMTDSGVTIEGYDTFKVGVQQLTLRYGGQETTLTVKLEQGEEIEGSAVGSGDDKGEDAKEERKAVDTGDNIETYIIYLVGSFLVIVVVSRMIKRV